MADTRLRGQEVTVRMARGGVTENTITAVKNFSLSIDMATLEEQYLGETSKRFDDIAHGCSGSFSVDVEDPAVFALIDFIVARAQRKVNPNQETVNITARFQFPDGRRTRAMIKDVKFDAIPIEVGGRESYVGTSFSFKAGIPRFL